MLSSKMLTLKNSRSHGTSVKLYRISDLDIILHTISTSRGGVRWEADWYESPSEIFQTPGTGWHSSQCALKTFLLILIS